MNERPYPPEWLTRRSAEAFVPAPELETWAMSTFVAEDGALVNPDHEHLRHASIAFLWTDVPCERGMLPIAGEAWVPVVQGNKWQRKRWEQQLAGWFGPRNLDFLITIDAVYGSDASDASFCALIEHELYHCAQEVDLFGAPKFTKEGMPKLGIRKHDVEEFVGVVRRYGVGHAAGKTAELVRAAMKAPEIGAAEVALACGTCGLKVA